MKYLYSIRFFILFSFLFYIFAAFSGFFAAKTSPEEAKIIFESLKQEYQPIFEMGKAYQFLFVFLNNSFSLFLAIVLGVIFGIFPLLSLFSNGGLLGIVAYFFSGALPWQKFFLCILPHGIIEIPVMILGCAIGLKIGKVSYRRIFKKEGSIKSELAISLKIFLKFFLPLFLLSAAIEIFITSKLIGL